MSYPAYSYLTPSTLNMALELARVLLAASEDVSTLGFGEANAMSLGTGRAGDRLVATREWIGPHRDTFEQLMENELDSARTTKLRLATEADAWSRFWARATNARNDRLHDEAMTVFGQSMDTYQERATAYGDKIEQDPEAAIFLTAPSPPTAPTRPPYVAAPTAASNYWPS
ncbi:MAG: hypothetical protein AAF531_16820 [Actinomycetota bacterium]